MVKTYRMKPEARQRLRRTFQLIGLGVASVLLYVSWLVIAKGLKDGDGVLGLAIPVGVAVTVGGLVGFRNLKRVEKTWMSMEIHVGPDAIRLSTHGSPGLEISREEVHGFSEGRRGFTLYGAGRKQMTVPADIEDYDEITNHVRQWVPPQSVTKQRWMWIAPTMASLVMAVAHWAPGILDDPAWKAAMHILAAGLFVWAYFELRKNSLLPGKSWGVLVFAAAELWQALDAIL